MKEHEITKEARDHFKKTIDTMSEQLSTIRASRVSPAILEPITVEYGGSKYRINDLAMIVAQDARTLLIEPWDNSMIPAISKAIQKANIGANPSDDGKSIKLLFPTLSQERRQELTKLVDKYLEEARIALRNIRREYVDEVKGKEKKKELSEDESRRVQNEIQKVYEEFEKEMEQICDKKRKEIMEE
ncbi:ribosome recycling factor [Coprothermobacter platensis]|jgi:ribosome recycling factor|uniref:ribosome recycling factor n=1 Tax=Coprothermobacter platensis TaxID=108819 RepID=UPI000367ECF4|nr:ribosome recycling factor [Coprothermobacter platensis]